MMKPALGIDIARLTFWAALRWDKQRVLKKEFDNTRGGFRQLRLWLKQHGVGAVRAAAESTNCYAEALLQWLHEEGHEVFLLNPERTVAYARSLGCRNKTDQADCATIAMYIALHDATPWRPPTPEQSTLRSLTRTRAQLVDCAKTLGSQRHTAGQAGRAYLDALYTKVREQLKQIEREIAQHLKQHPILGEQVQRLMTFKGIGLITAAIIVAEIPPVDENTDPRTIAGWAGLTPRRRQSGKEEWRTTISRKGNAHLRHALYMPALVAKRRNALMRDFAKRLADKGKKPTAILGAIAHKMLRICVGLLKSKTDFDPTWSFQKN